MNRRDEAVEAAKGASVSPDPYPTLPEMLHDWADTARKADTILKDIPMPQPRRDEAVETGARAILHGATIDSFYAQGDWGAAGYDVQQSMLKAARDALEAALAILQPTVPSEVDALEALPVGTVLRGDAREAGVIVAHLTCLGWTEGEVPYDSTRLLFRHADLLGIDSWLALWMPEGES